MAVMPNIYASGGRVFLGDWESDTWDEIALVQSFEFKVSSQSEEVMDWSHGLPLVFDSFVNKVEYSVEFTTKDINHENIAKAFFGVATTGEDNPTEGGFEDATKVTRIEIGAGMQYQGSLKFESENVRGRRKILILYKTPLSSDTALGLISDKAAEIKFSAKAGVGTDGTPGYILMKEE